MGTCQNTHGKEVFGMAYVPVPKDLSKIKTKVAFNLTKRQIIRGHSLSVSDIVVLHQNGQDTAQ